MYSQKDNDPAIIDIITSIEKLKRIAEFGSEFEKLVSSLANTGIDISKVNPSNLNDLIKMAVIMGKSDEITEIDIEALKNTYEDIINMRMSEIRNMCITIRKFIISYREVISVLYTISSKAKAGREELELIKSMFGLTTKTSSKAKEEYDDIEQIEQLTKEEIEDLKSLIRRKS